MKQSFPLLPGRIKRPSCRARWKTHCPYMGWLYNGSRKPWSCRWTELRLQCNCVRTKGNSWMHGHVLSSNNLMARVWCSDGMTGMSWRNGNRDWHGGGVGGIHLLHSSVLCTLPLTRGGVEIRLRRSRRLATSAHTVGSSWGAPAQTALVSVPQLTKLFTDFRFQLLELNIHDCQISLHYIISHNTCYYSSHWFGFKL